MTARTSAAGRRARPRAADDGRSSAWDWSPTDAAAACALHALDIDEIRLRFGTLLARGVDSGNADLEQYGAYGLAQAELAAGNLGRAAELTDLVEELAAETGVLTLPGARLRAEIDALAGRSAEARARLDVVISESEAVGERRYTWQARAALGALELAEGRAADAAEELRAARELAEEVGMRDPALVASFVDEIEAAAEANLLDQADEALAAARRLGQPEWGPPLLLRASAVVAARRGRLEEAESSLADALRPRRRSRSSGDEPCSRGDPSRGGCADERPRARRWRRRCRSSSSSARRSGPSGRGRSSAGSPAGAQSPAS